MHSMSTSAEGSVKGKKLGRKRILTFSPNRARMKYSSVPLRWAKVTPSSMTRPSTWIEHRQVRRVGRLAAEDAAGADDADGRLRPLHDPDLDGRGVGPQEQVALDEERVPLVAGRMVGREVEGLEVVVVGLDLGALLDGEAHAEEDPLDLLLEERRADGAPRRSASGRGASGRSARAGAAGRSGASRLEGLRAGPGRRS